MIRGSVLTIPDEIPVESQRLRNRRETQFATNTPLNFTPPLKGYTKSNNRYFANRRNEEEHCRYSTILRKQFKYFFKYCSFNPLLRREI